MASKNSFDSRGTVGDVKSIRGFSTELNTQRMIGAEKPMFSGSASPGGTKPMRASESKVPMPK